MDAESVGFAPETARTLVVGVADEIMPQPFPVNMAFPDKHMAFPENPRHKKTCQPDVQPKGQRRSKPNIPLCLQVFYAS
jgi:hypothetical protein